jgi:hypothetical protein
MNNETYNGWANYATWKVNLELLDGVTSEDLFGGECEPEQIKDYIWEMVTDGYPDAKPDDFAMRCMFDMLHDVDWYEIAECLNED